MSIFLTFLLGGKVTRHTCGHAGHISKMITSYLELIRDFNLR